MSKKTSLEEIEQSIKKTAEKLFGECTPEEEDALKNIQTIGSPKNVSEPTDQQEDEK